MASGVAQREWVSAHIPIDPVRSDPGMGSLAGRCCCLFKWYKKRAHECIIIANDGFQTSTMVHVSRSDFSMLCCDQSSALRPHNHRLRVSIRLEASDASAFE